MDRKIQIDIRDATWFVDELRLIFADMVSEGLWKARVFFETIQDAEHQIVPAQIQITQIQITWNSGVVTQVFEPQDTGPRPVSRIRRFCGVLLQKIWYDSTTYFDINGHVDFDVRTRDVLLSVDEKVVHTVTSSEYIYAEPLDDGAA